MKQTRSFYLRLSSFISTLLACFVAALASPIWIPYALSPTQEIIRKYSMFDLRVDAIATRPFTALTATFLMLILLLQLLSFWQKNRHGLLISTTILYGLGIATLLVPAIVWSIPRWNGWLIVLCLLLAFGFVCHLLLSRNESLKETVKS